MRLKLEILHSTKKALLHSLFARSPLLSFVARVGLVEANFIGIHFFRLVVVVSFDEGALRRNTERRAAVRATFQARAIEISYKTPSALAE